MVWRMARKRSAAPRKQPARGGRVRRAWRALFAGYWKGRSKGQRLGGSIAAIVVAVGAFVGILAAFGIVRGGGSGNSGTLTSISAPSGGISHAPIKTPGGGTIYRIDTGSDIKASVRGTPETQGRRLAKLSDGTKVRILCTKQGQLIESNLGNSTIWDYVQPVGRSVRGYVSDTLIYTGKSGAVAGACH